MFWEWGKGCDTTTATNWLDVQSDITYCCSFKHKNKVGPKTVIHVRFLRLTCLSWIILTTHLNGHIIFNASSLFWGAFHIWYHQWHLCVQLVYEPHPHCGGQPGKVNKSREWRYHVTVGTGWGMCHEKRSFKSNMSQASAISVGFLFQAGETSEG